MKFSEDLAQHAVRLLGNATGQVPMVDLRRAVSAAYYALFHHLSEAAVEQVAPHLPSMQSNRVHRWLDHTEMKKICREFSAIQLKSPLRDLLGGSVSEDMQTVALNFVKLQEARHSADYDLDFQLSLAQAREFVTMAINAIGAWEKVAPSAESNIFVLSLFLWKKWDTVRS